MRMKTIPLCNARPFLLCGGVYGTLYYQAVATGYTATDSAVYRYVCPDPTSAWGTGSSIVQSPSHCGGPGSLESTFWLGSAAVHSVFQMGWKCARWRLRFFVCDEPASIDCHLCP